MTDVLKRANLNQIEMEYAEARLIAERENIDILGDEERKRILLEMAKELNNLESKLLHEVAEKKKLQSEKKMINATFTLSFAVRRWRVKGILRLKFLDTYEKLFDKSYQAFYYRNKKTVTFVFSSFLHQISQLRWRILWPI